MSSNIRLTPVGHVRAEQGKFYLSIMKKYKTALTALEGFGHIQVVWWADQSDSAKKRERLIVASPYKNSPDEVGIFATRSEVRPNPVLITTASVIRVDVDKGIVELPWIDAENNSPVIDIKPYQPCFDRVKTVRLPEWCEKWPMWQEDSGAFDWPSVFNF